MVTNCAKTVIGTIGNRFGRVWNEFSPGENRIFTNFAPISLPPISIPETFVFLNFKCLISRINAMTANKLSDYA